MCCFELLLACSEQTAMDGLFARHGVQLFYSTRLSRALSLSAKQRLSLCLSRSLSPCLSLSRFLCSLALLRSCSWSLSLSFLFSQPESDKKMKLRLPRTRVGGGKKPATQKRVPQAACEHRLPRRYSGADGAGEFVESERSVHSVSSSLQEWRRWPKAIGVEDPSVGPTARSRFFLSL